MSASVWTRAARGLPVAVEGGCPASPEGVASIEGRLDRGLDGMAPFAEQLAGCVADPAAVLRLPLVERLLYRDRPVPDALAVAALPEGTVAVLRGADGADPSVEALVVRWLRAPRLPVVVVAGKPCSLTARFRADWGKDAVVEGTSSPMVEDAADLELALVAARAGGRCTPEQVADALGIAPLRALVQLERAVGRLPVEADDTGYRFDRAWLAQVLDGLSPFARRSLRPDRAPDPSRLDATGARLLGAWALAEERCVDGDERAALLWHRGRGGPLPSGCTPRVAAHLLWEWGDEEGLRGLPLPGDEGSRLRQLVALRWDPVPPSELAPEIQVIAPFVRSGSDVTQSLGALASLLDRAEGERRARLQAWRGRLLRLAGRDEEAAAALGGALPGLYEVGAWRLLARSIAELVAAAPEAVGPDLLGWLELTVAKNIGDTDGIAWCRRALEGVDATDGELAATVRRLGMEIRALDRAVPAG